MKTYNNLAHDIDKVYLSLEYRFIVRNQHVQKSVRLDFKNILISFFKREY